MSIRQMAIGGFHAERAYRTLQTTQTHQALAFAVAGFLKVFDAELCAMESKHATLSAAYGELRPKFAKLRALFSILDKAFHAEDPLATTAQRVAHTLTVLHYEAVEVESVSESAPGMGSLSLELFAETCRPLLEFLHEWITSGAVTDPHDEFPIVAEAADIYATHEWHRCHLRRADDWPSASTIPKMAGKQYTFDRRTVPVFLEPIICKVSAHPIRLA